MHDLVCISHLRWDFVWQRPQHLLSRLAQTRRLFFVEEPIAVVELDQPRLDQYQWRGPGGAEVTVMRLLQPVEQERWIGHGDSLTDAHYRELLQAELARQGVDAPVLWLYTPMAAHFVDALTPSVLVYDVMDQLSAFKGAPPDLVARDRAVLQQADIVFTGGASLYRDKAPHNPNTHLFASGVDIDHFGGHAGLVMPEELRALRRPILGYYGVIDERMDLPLLAEMAKQHPEWSLVMIGPVVKISEDDLPQAPNIHYLGMRGYDDLPAYLRYFDVALVPFAISEATRYLSPTKTLEYMAAHKPIVSTPIHDVIELYGTVVGVGHTHVEFIALVEQALNGTIDPQQRTREDELLAQHTWDAIAGEMATLIDQQVAQVRVQQPVAATK